MDCGSKQSRMDEVTEMVRGRSPIRIIPWSTIQRRSGVYFCQDASVSLSGYAQPSMTVWEHSMIKPAACCTLAEIVNCRHNFVHNAPPYFVVDKTEWIMW